MRHENIVILTGAGISKESGIDTFRDKGGIWSKVKVEDVATPQAFEKNPSTVQKFYNGRRANLLDPSIKPNAAHFALARLEREWQGDVAVVTQNIDNLHEAAGTKNLIHMHGELLKARCTNCGLVLDWDKPLGEGEKCPDCYQKTLRPHVVWFGETPLMMGSIDQLLANCNLFLSIGAFIYGIIILFNFRLLYDNCCSIPWSRFSSFRNGSRFIKKIQSCKVGF